MIKKQYDNKTVIGWTLIVIAALLPNLLNESGLDYVAYFLSSLFVMLVIFSFVSPSARVTKRVIKSPFSDLDAFFMLQALWIYYHNNKRIQKLLYEIIEIMQKDLTGKS